LVVYGLDNWVELLAGVSLSVLWFLCSGLAMLSAGLVLMDHSLVLGYKRDIVSTFLSQWPYGFCVGEHLMTMPLLCIDKILTKWATLLWLE